MAAYDGSIRIDTRINEKGFNQGISGIGGALKGIGAAIGVAFGVGVLIKWGAAAVQTASQSEAAWIGLRSIVEGTGNSFEGAKGFLEDYISDGLIPMTNAITAYKNLAMRGYDTEQIEKTLRALKDASAFGRQASYSMGEAVQTATEGLKNENSILVDNAGVTKNVSIMWKEYAASIGTTVGNLTQQQKIQAEVNGIMNETRFQVGDAAKVAGTYAGKVAALSTSMYNLKVAVGSSLTPILSVIIPAIKRAVDWLVVFFNKVAQIMAALFGTQVQTMESVAESTDSASAAQGGLAKNTEKAGKAAKGALAAFDELNVLQQDTESDGGGGISGGIGGGIPAGPQDPEGASSKWEDLANRIKAFFEPIMEPLKRIWDAFGRISEQLKRTTESILKDLGPVFIWLRDNVLLPILNLLAGVFEKIATWMEENPEEVKAMAIAFGVLALALLLILSPAAQVIAIILAVIVVVGLLIKYWPEISRVAAIVVNAVINFFVNLWNSIKTGVVDMYNAVVKWFTNLWTGIKNVWSIAKAWFQVTVIDPIVRAWNTATTSIKGFFTRTFDAIKTTVKGVINQIIDFVNNLISNIVNGINNVITLANNIPGVSIDMITAPKIPHLASGAVIPPNAAFLAMLGDQRSGTNIEAPEELIRQIVREETGGGQGVTINFAGNMGALVRAMKPYIDKENTRIGRSLVKARTA